MTGFGVGDMFFRLHRVDQVRAGQAAHVSRLPPRVADGDGLLRIAVFVVAQVEGVGNPGVGF